MRFNLRGVAMTGVLALAGSSGIGVSAARACDHGPAPEYGPGPRWGYGSPATATVRFGGQPYDDDCSVCRRLCFVPPACPPPPCDDEGYMVGSWTRVVYRDYRRMPRPVRYPAPRQLFPTPQSVTSYEEPYDLATPTFPTKQTPAVYGTPQYPDPSSGPSSAYADPQAQPPYPSEGPPADDGQVPPIPSPVVPPQR